MQIKFDRNGQSIIRAKMPGFEDLAEADRSFWIRKRETLEPRKNGVCLCGGDGKRQDMSDGSELEFQQQLVEIRSANINKIFM